MNKLRRLAAALCALALALSLAPAARAAEGPMKSDNAYQNAYGRFPQCIRSYLYVNASGGLTRVEYNKFNGKLTVEDYNGAFQLQSRRTIPKELSVWGAFFPGKDYNFLITGQDNSKQSDSSEVIRVTKFDKNWNRLGQASVSGINTRFPFEAGATRCAEAGGMLYIHTSHQMYNGHQSNMNIVIRQSDLAVTSTNHEVGRYFGYVSHSFNQYILVDQSGNILTADHGDGYPRAMQINMICGAAGKEWMDVDGLGGETDVQRGDAETDRFPGEVGDNVTYASLGGFAETSSGYLIAYSQSMGKNDPSQIKLGYIAKSSFRTQGFYSNGYTGPNTIQVRQVTNNTSAGQIESTPTLVPTGLSGGWVLWNTRDDDYSDNAPLHYAAYSADGTTGPIQTAAGVPLSDCQPILWNGKVVWYVTDDSIPTFYTLDASGVTATPAGGAAQTVQPSQPGTQPGTSGGGLFQDVSPGHWAYQDIAACTEAGIIKGFGDGIFRPDRNISCAEFASMLTRTVYGDALQAAEQQRPAGAPWYYPNQKVLQDKSLDRGTSLEGDGWSAYAGNAISRYEMAVLLNNVMEDQSVYLRVAARLNNLYAMGEIQKTLPSDFTSQWRKTAIASIADWDRVPEEYRDGVAQCFAFGALTGMSGGSFSGGDPMTRAQACVVIQRLDGLVKGRLPAGHFWLQ